MGISIDIPKAREIHKGELRIERKEKLEALDILFMKAQEAGEDTSDIVAKKQLLRDATKAVVEYMLSPDYFTAIATNVNDAGSTRISAHTGFDTSLYWSPVVQAQAAVLSDALAANSFRFDGSDNMPPAVGAGTFWVEMTELATNGPSYIDTALDNIENSWP